MRYTIISFLSILFIIVAVWGWRYATAPIEGKVAARERVQSADFRLYSYDHFFDLCVAVKRARASHRAQREILNAMSPDDRGYVRQRRVVAAQKTHVVQLIAQYNADAAKEETTGQFRSSNLPTQIEKGQPLLCGR